MRQKGGLYGKTGLWDYNSARRLAEMLWQRLSRQKKEQQQKYLILIQYVLTWFQFIEERLKIYLSMSFGIIKSSVGKRIAFKYTSKDIDGMSLGKLLYVFKKFNKNAELHRKIENIIPRRNYYAHRGYVLYAGTKKDIEREVKWLRKHINECEKLWPKLDNILIKLNEEIKDLQK